MHGGSGSNTAAGRRRDRLREDQYAPFEDATNASHPTGLWRPTIGSPLARIVTRVPAHHWATVFRRAGCAEPLSRQLVRRSSRSPKAGAYPGGVAVSTRGACDLARLVAFP